MHGFVEYLGNKTSMLQAVLLANVMVLFFLSVHQNSINVATCSTAYLTV